MFFCAGTVTGGAACEGTVRTEGTEQRVEEMVKICRTILQFEIFALVGCYAAQIGTKLPTFRENLSVPSSRV
jgi:hypothetical protein